MGLTAGQKQEQACAVQIWPSNYIVPFSLFQIAQVQVSAKLLDVSGMESKHAAACEGYTEPEDSSDFVSALGICLQPPPQPQGRLRPLGANLGRRAQL